MAVSFVRKLGAVSGGALAVGVFAGSRLSAAARDVDKASGGVITRTLAHDYFSGKEGELSVIPGVRFKSGGCDRILLYGCGEIKRKVPLEDDFFRHLGARLYKAVAATKDKVLHIAAEAIVSESRHACLLGYGAEFYSYEFTRYRSRRKSSETSQLRSIKIYCDVSAAQDYADYRHVLTGSRLARDLVSEPPNELYPATFAERCKLLREAGVKVTVLGEKALTKLGMRALLGVGQGSARESYAVVMEWAGSAKKSESPLAFIGKGVTFDTGGISLKPGPGMEEMKWDMAGAATVTGLMYTLALRKAAVNAVGLIGLVENMPDGYAQRPGDIVRSYDGQTIEIHNTDAEGRLVLADLLGYCQDKFKPACMIDLATLTGAIIISLGHEHAGLFDNNEELAKQLTEAGNASGEKLWRLPLHSAYDKLLNTAHADMKNIGGRAAGSITAAQFLKRFVKNCPWAHLDIAGVAWWNKETAMGRIGASGFGVALLDQWVKNKTHKT